MPPKLSVVMPVRNAMPFLEASVQSILGQSFGDFEFVIGDDGSTDGSTDCLRRLAQTDRRIRLVEGKGRRGPAGSSNWVAGLATASLVARMDADDISHPDRLRREMEALQAAPSAVMVGTLWRGIDETGAEVRASDRWRLARSAPFAPFAHGSVMIRREAFERVGGYRASCDYWEDLDLFLRLAALGPVIVLPDVLYDHRLSGASTRVASEQQRVEKAVDMMYRCIAAYRAKGSYEDVLAGGFRTCRLHPELFISLGSNALWAGRRPAMLGRLIRRGALSADRASLAALAWAFWADISPKSLRAMLRLLLAHRNRKTPSATGPLSWAPSAGGKDM